MSEDKSIEELDKELRALGVNIPDLNKRIARFKVELQLQLDLKNARRALDGEKGFMAAIIQTINDGGVKIEGRLVGRHNVIQGVRALIAQQHIE